ncbi:MAG TPA: NADH-quinone oxidoreductase subunit C [Acidobacteriaceae bacterium]|jgi:NADH-quinone oxidoreductase subunit C|nr:NADH-quinone oxidoreductase subunit C [Acidobacteriaceae bacterium]
MNLETIKSEIEANVPGCRVELVANPSPSAQHSLLLDADHAAAVAIFLRDAPNLRFDFCSNVTGIDWPGKEVSQKVKLRKLVDGVEQEVEETRTTTIPGSLEVVYHLYSVEKKHGPLTLRMRTQDRDTGVHLPSLTPIWRSAELQEREIFDLYGVVFDGHPDLRRLLMWDEFQDYPMRRDYVDPDDYEYEPTAHDDVLQRAQQHLSHTDLPQASEAEGR